MLQARERFWAGLQTETSFKEDGTPRVIVTALPHTGVIFNSNNCRLHSSERFRPGCVLDVDIGDDNQAFAVLQGELFHEDRSVRPHLLVTWLYWEQDSDPVYQTEYTLDEDEVMPSDELDIIPFSAVSEILCPIKDLPRRADQCNEHYTIFWKKTHVYVSGESAVTDIAEATSLPTDSRQPDKAAFTEATCWRETEYRYPPARFVTRETQIRYKDPARGFTAIPQR